MKLYFRLTEAKQKELLLQGKTLTTNQAVDIDFEKLSEADRKTIIDNTVLYRDELFFGSSGTYDNKWAAADKIDAYTVNEIIQKMRIISEKRKADKEKKEAEEKQKIQKITEEIAVNRNAYLNSREETVKLIRKWHYHPVANHFKPIDDETKEYISRIEKELDDEKEQAEIDKIKKVQAGKDNLHAWALQNGSDLLKARIEENMNWIQLANDEYFESIKPEGFEYLDSPDEEWDIKNATIEQIAALREVKKDFPEAKLMRYKYQTHVETEYDDDDDETTTEHKDVVAIYLVSLDWSEKRYEKLIEG